MARVGFARKLTLHRQQEAQAEHEAGESLVSSDNVHHATIGRLGGGPA